MEIINLNKICGGCASVGLGSKLDTLEKDLEEGNTYSGELLTDEEVNTLNNICPVLSQLSLGTYINNILTASKEGTEVENLTEEQIDMLNHQTCGGFETMEVGSKISDFVEEINEGGGGTTVLRLDIKDKAGELVPEDIIVTNNDEFIPAFNAVKVGKTVDVSIGGEIGGIVVPESERITMKLTKTSETEGNFRHELVPYNYASLYISGGYCNLVTYYYEVHSPNKIKFNDIFSDANIFDYIDYISNQSHSGFFYLCGLNITSDAGDDLIGFMAPESGVHNKCNFYLDEPFENQLIVGLEMQESSNMDFKLVNNNVSSEAEFLTYNFTVGSDEYFEGVIDSEKGTITIDNETLTPLGVVTPSFTLSENAVATINGVIQTSDVTDVDLTQPVTYTVTAEDGTTKDWTIVIKYGPDTRHWDGENPEGVSKLFFKDAIDFSGSAYWESFKTEMAETIDRPIEFTIFNIDCIGDLDISVGEISTGEYDIYLYDHSGNLLANWRNLYEGDVVTKIDGVGSYESLEHPIGLCKDDIASSEIPSIGKVILDCVEISADE